MYIHTLSTTISLGLACQARRGISTPLARGVVSPFTVHSQLGITVHSQFLHQLGLHLLENTKPLDLGEQVSRVLGARDLLKLHQ